MDRVKRIIPEATQGVIRRVEGSIFGYQGWPSVAKDEKGTLYAVVSGFRVAHVCPFGKTVMHISHDDGNTWSPPIVINDTYMDDRDVGILYLGNGKLLVTWFTHSTQTYRTHYYDYIIGDARDTARNTVRGYLEDYPALPAEDQVGGSYVRISEDYGFTWGDIIRVPVSAPHGPSRCRDGSLIYFGNKMYEDGVNCESEDRNDRVFFCKSTDGGVTWHTLHRFLIPDWVVEPTYLCEPHVIELPSGRLFGAIRIDGGGRFSVATTWSDDGGVTWSYFVDTGFQGAPPHLCLHSSGALICSIGRRSEPFGEYAMVSYDFGETWTEEYALNTNATDGDLGYPATVELGDGSLLTVYYQKLPGDGKTAFLYTNWKLAK